MNNGKKNYEDLSDDEKASVVESGGHYSLKTNIDFPQLTYSTITTTTSSTGGTSTVVSDPITIDIDNPDPVALAEQKLSVEKKWDDTMDPSQREEVESVNLTLKIDGKEYGSVVLSEEDDWKKEDFVSVAPGVMISNPSNPAYEHGKKFLTYEGKTYAILEDGHDYVFSEEDINNHFELTAYKHHPMIIDGEVKSVTFTRDADGNITGIKDIYKIDTLSATNTIKGGINIEKKVVDETGATVDSKDKFTAVAHLVDKDGSDYHYDYRIYYGQNNPEYNRE